MEYLIRFNIYIYINNVLHFRVRKKNLDFVKTVLTFAFSQVEHILKLFFFFYTQLKKTSLTDSTILLKVGVILLCVAYAVLGANTFMSMEGPAEEQR